LQRDIRNSARRLFRQQHERLLQPQFVDTFAKRRSGCLQQPVHIPGEIPITRATAVTLSVGSRNRTLIWSRAELRRAATTALKRLSPIARCEVIASATRSIMCRRIVSRVLAHTGRAYPFQAFEYNRGAAARPRTAAAGAASVRRRCRHRAPRSPGVESALR